MWCIVLSIHVVAHEMNVQYNLQESFNNVTSPSEYPHTPRDTSQPPPLTASLPQISQPSSHPFSLITSTPHTLTTSQPLPPSTAVSLDDIVNDPNELDNFKVLNPVSILLLTSKLTCTCTCACSTGIYLHTCIHVYMRTYPSSLCYVHLSLGVVYCCNSYDCVLVCCVPFSYSRSQKDFSKWVNRCTKTPFTRWSVSALLPFNRSPVPFVRLFFFSRLPVCPFYHLPVQASLYMYIPV